MQNKKRNTLGILFSLVLFFSAASSFTTPQSSAFDAAQDTSNQSLATKAKASQSARQSTSVTSIDRHIACKRGCEEKYSSCLAAKKAKGWDVDRAEKMCGLSARSCQGGCDR